MTEAFDEAEAGAGDEAEPVSRPVWWRRRVPLGLVAGIVVVCLVGLAVLLSGIASRDDDISALESESAAAASERDEALADVEERDAALDVAEDEIADEKARADDAEDVALGTAEDALAEQVAAVEKREADAKTKEDDLAARERTLDATINGLKATQFEGGVFQVGRDIQPGTYHTEGTDETCYYAKLAADGEEILDNNNVDGPVTLRINSPYFESSSRCGVWTKIG